MKVPKILKICGHDIEVETSKGDLTLEGGEIWGYYDDDKHLIKIAPNMVSTRKMEVVLHEVIHAISAIHCLGLTEKQVKILGVEILAVIRNNKLNFLSTRRVKKNVKI